jgi:hypothetical protein
VFLIKSAIFGSLGAVDFAATLVVNAGAVAVLVWLTGKEYSSERALYSE